MKNKEIAELSTEDLLTKCSELRSELIKLNVSVSTKTSLKNPGQIKSTKKTIAKILTELNARKHKKALAKEAKTEKQNTTQKNKRKEVSK